jgi:DNA adenine methylase
MSRIQAPIRIASDAHTDLILLWKAIQLGWLPPINVSEKEYRAARSLTNPSALRGFIGFGCSHSGKWFGGYARDNRGYNYAEGAKRSLEKVRPKVEGVRFLNLPYQKVDTSAILGLGPTLVYCDPPYANTSSDYEEGKFDSVAFWAWAQALSEHACVYVSEYEAPDTFSVAWQKDVTTCMHRNDGTQIARVEKLFFYKGDRNENDLDTNPKAHEKGVGHDPSPTRLSHYAT